jgi:hypothetical protein
MTLLEILIASVIFAVILGVSFSLTVQTTQSFDESINFNYLQGKGEKSLKKMIDEIGDAHALSPNNVVDGGFTFPNAEIGYRVPVTYGDPSVVKPGSNFQVVQPAGLPVFREPTANPTLTGDFYLTLDFGWRDERLNVTNLDNGLIVPIQGPGLRTAEAPDGVNLVGGRTPNGHMSFRFVINRTAPLGADGIFDESVERIDIDGDGKMDASYAVGRIERAIWLDNDNNTATGLFGDESLLPISQVSMADSNVLLPLVNIAGDPAQMKTNRLFVKVGSRVDINMWLASVGPSRIPRVVFCSSSVFLRNN